ncbi:efflux RND transporter periplasmic adaptor subunit [Lysobacter sp. M15]|jgi:HlyD family secretion protein|uniref:efflux RND transporter periplasmic adaptor subunit n=1 Tax=Lysobacter sp. M15 TaxID=2916837 RepID=UPI001F59C18C|nr:efflux RND transporter periplasmic adaptor subunit [Lysobacter sp. M15]
MTASANHVPRRQLFWLLLAVVVGIAAWGFWPRALPVETARIARGPLTVSFNEEARTRLHDRWMVSAPLPGVVERIVLRPGDAVAAGQTVAVLVPARASLFDPMRRADAQARVSSAMQAEAAASAAIVAAEAERTRSRAELRRASALAADRLIARADLDAIRAGAASAEAALRSARAQRESARIERDAARAVLALQGAPGGDARVELPAPVAGRIVRRLVESATPVQAGQPLLEIGDPQAIEVIAEVLTTDAVRLSPGTPVQLTRWGGDAPLRGRVQTVEPGGFTKVSALGVEEQRVLVVMTLQDPASARVRLGDGFRLEAEFIVWQSPDALSVPTAALFRDGARWAVYAVEEGRARLRHVTIGRMGDDAAELKAGLREGDQVIVYPGDTVRDRRRVRGE